VTRRVDTWCPAPQIAFKDTKQREDFGQGLAADPPKSYLSSPVWTNIKL